MSEYCPDNWVVIKIYGSPIHYKVLAGWSGGYLSGSSWKLNSGVTKVEESGDYYLFHGSSGSVYKCHKEAYCLRNNNAYVWNALQEKYGDKVELLEENTDWHNMEWGI
jgi:hypothetical protein